MPDKYIINGLGFSTKQKVTNYVRTLLHKNKVGMYLGEEDLAFMIALLETHHDAVRKIGCGVVAIRTMNSINNTVCFELERRDGSKDDFSFYKCLGSKPYSNKAALRSRTLYKVKHKKVELRQFKVACRNAIVPEIIQFRLNNKWVSAITGEPLSKINVDHVYPITFDQIIYNYLNEYSIDWRCIPINTQYAQSEFVHSKDRLDFAAYHQKVAVLRIVSPTENQCAPRAKIDWSKFK